MSRPEAYTHGHHESVLRSHRWRTAENSVAYLLPHLVPGATVVDVGSGPGTITVDLAERVAPGTVIGIDAAPEIVADAGRLAAGRGLDNVTFRVGDAYALDLPGASADIVHTHQMLHHLARPVDALREFARVARPDGLISAREIDYEGVFWYPLIPALDEWLDLYLRVHRGSGGEPSAGRRLKSWAQEAGLSDIRSTASVWLYESDDDRAWWGDSWAHRVLESSFAELALARGEADRATLERIASGWREWAAAPDGWLVMPHGEILAKP